MRWFDVYRHTMCCYIIVHLESGTAHMVVICSQINFCCLQKMRFAGLGPEFSGTELRRPSIFPTMLLDKAFEPLVSLMAFPWCFG